MRGRPGFPAALALLSTQLLGCPAALPEFAPAAPLLLAHQPQALVALELPSTNHPHGLPTPSIATLRQEPERCWRDEGLEAYCVALPVGQVFYGHTTRTPPDGMALLGPDDEELVYNWDRSAQPELTTWRARAGELQIRPALGSEPPRAGSLRVRYPPAAAWENALDPASSTLEGAAFALRELSVDDELRRGVLLPAPGLARWRVTVPPGAVLDLEARLLEPAVDQGLASDGALLRLRVHADGVVTELKVHRLACDGWNPIRADLEAWAGQQVELELISEPGDSPLLDYVFLANPVVYSPSQRPRQVVLVFVDTLRRDHVGAYGYERPTTPALDAWMSGAAVFDDARATSSWTLPSARALLTGMPQGAWGQAVTLQERLAELGFVTGAFVANAFLTSAFDMGHGWGWYGYHLLAPADEQVDRAIAFLDRHKDRDAMVMVQQMDPHMPYNEPEAYQGRWAGEEPEGLAGKINRRGLRGLNLRGERQDLVRDYLVGRYDQNILFMDHELERLLGSLREDAVVVVFSDHGEEFFEHGSVEHGHTLYDELLRVPLAIRAPGLPPGRVEVPVSLLDLTPTLLDQLGAEGHQDLLGRSLLPAAKGDTQAMQELAARAHFFGGLLYDDEAWGVLAPEGLKWVARGGTQQLYDLRTDPDELQDLAGTPEADLQRFPPLLAQALEREVRPVWRLYGPGDGRIVQDFEGRVTLHHGAGFEQAWHPLSLTGDMANPVLAGSELSVAQGDGLYLPREIFVQPVGDPLDVADLQLVVECGEDSWTGQRSPRARDPSLVLARRQTLVTAGRGDHRFTLTLHQSPLPYPHEGELEANDGGMNEHREALGYIDE